MFVLAPLKRRDIALLWSGQLLSAIGDELHKVALVWLAASLLGLNTGYLAAAQAGSVFLLSTFGGIWADRWNHEKTMIWVDIIRALSVLALPLMSFFSPPSLWVLIPVSVVVTGLNALFSPALHAIVPRLVTERRLLQATNGLIETTTRFGRVIGPGIVAALNSLIPLIHFFTIDALSFFTSAGTLAVLFKTAKLENTKTEPEFTTTRKEAIFGGFKTLKTNGLLQYLVLTNGIINPLWYVVYPLGVGLELHKISPDNVGGLGLVISGYGIGNVISNLVVGSFRMERPAFFGFLGRMLMGLGFIGLGFAPSIRWMMLASAFAATGGPMTDLSFLAILQKEFKNSDIAKIYRLDMAITHGALVLCFLATPFLFKTLTIPLVIGLCGLTMVIVAGLGFLKFQDLKTQNP